MENNTEQRVGIGKKYKGGKPFYGVGPLKVTRGLRRQWESMRTHGPKAVEAISQQKSMIA